MMDEVALPFDQTTILKYLPHRPPMLMLDSVVHYDETHIEARKKTVADEFYFQGHFPNNPVMPGVMQVEAIAQAGALLASLNGYFDKKTHLLAFASIDKARFRKPVYPNETLCVYAQIVKHRKNLYKFSGRIEVDNVVMTNITFSAAAADKILAEEGAQK